MLNCMSEFAGIVFFVVGLFTAVAGLVWLIGVIIDGKDGTTTRQWWWAIRIALLFSVGIAGCILWSIGELIYCAWGAF